MAPLAFYHLVDIPQERAAFQLLSKCRAQGWNVLVAGTDKDRLGALDERLWRIDEAAFLAHGMAGGAHDKDQPILLSVMMENTNNANVLMLVDGARVEPDQLGGFERAFLLFDGADPGALAAARSDWKRLAGQGVALTYWSQETGQWVQKATANAPAS